MQGSWRSEMNKNPRVYVIVPIYNVEPYLRECLDSVVNQTYKNLSIILVNDGSTDNSEAIAKEYLSDERVILISKENGGLSSARNAGLKKAYLEGDDEDYILFLDSDDYLSLSYVESMVKSLVLNPDSQIVRGSVRGICEDKIVFKEIQNDENKTYGGLEYLASIPNHYFSFSWGGGKNELFA